MKTICIAAAALALAAPFAARPAKAIPPAGEIAYSGQRIALIPNEAGKYVPPLAHKSKLKTIISNFATAYPKGPYNAFVAVPINGPDTLHGQIAFATAFTLTAAATVQEVDIAGGWAPGSNAKKPIMQLHIYADANGVPGTELWSGKAVVAEAGTCCNVIAIHVEGGLALNAAAQYWLGATPAPGGSSFAGAWDLNVLDQVTPTAGAVNQGNGWVAQQEPTNFAYGLYGR